MLNQIQTQQLKTIYEYFKRDDFQMAEHLFSAMKITDTPEHLSQSKEVRHLIWNLYEFLIIGDHQNFTDKETIVDAFTKIFPELLLQ